MDDNIVVGILVGLAVGTSLYVWNSDSFTKPQKIGLICCIIFPPLQWVLILLVLAYNKHQSENTVEAKIIKQNVESKQNLDSTKNNLKELKEKGIITEEEFNSKVEKIESQKTEFDIKNSTEYKQLKSLLVSGILTREEFETKISLIKETPIKKVSVEESERLKVYKENIKLPTNEEPKKENSDNTFVYLFIGVAVIFLLIFIISQNVENNVEQNYDSPASIAVDSSAYEDVNPNYNYQEPIKNKKFVYVVFNLETPKLDKFTIEGSYDYNTNFHNPSKTLYSTNWEKSSFQTEILEIEDYNEDNKNRILDQTEAQMYEKLRIYDSNYNSDIIVNCNDDREKEKLKEAKSKIIDRNIYKFDSYSEASISKRNN